MKKKLASAALAASLVGVVFVGGTLAYFTDSDSATNTITTGKVDISIWEGTKDNRIQSLEFLNVMPGDTLTVNPTITIEEGSADSYLRFALDIASTSDTALTDTQLAGIYDLIDDQMIANGWIYSDLTDYYYYQTPVENAGSPVGDYNIFSEINVPTEWGNEYADLGFTMSFTAEAIQGKNFTPYRNSDNVIYAWYETEAPAERTEAGIIADGTALTLTADENGNVTLPASAEGTDGWYDATSHICYTSGATVALDAIVEGSTFTSMDVEVVTPNKVSYYLPGNVALTADQMDGEFTSIVLPVLAYGSEKQTDCYVSLRALAPSVEGYQTGDIYSTYRTSTTPYVDGLYCMYTNKSGSMITMYSVKNDGTSSLFADKNSYNESKLSFIFHYIEATE